jgi:hypothetical protein
MTSFWIRQISQKRDNPMIKLKARKILINSFHSSMRNQIERTQISISLDKMKRKNSKKKQSKIKISIEKI